VDPTTRSFASEREWLDHLRILAELPYPSLPLALSILPIARLWVRADMGGLGWAQDGSIYPDAFVTEYLNERAFVWWQQNLEYVFTELHPLKELIETQGNSHRALCDAPGFADTEYYREVMQRQGFRWAALAPVRLQIEHRWSFLALYRSAEHGRFTDEEQSALYKGAQALAQLDSPTNPMAALPPCEQREVASSSLIISSDGNMVMRSQSALHLLYLLGEADAHSMDWARPDWGALPQSAREFVQIMFEAQSLELRRTLKLQRPWGSFEFALEKMPNRSMPGASVVVINIRYFEPIDITVARRLTGWKLSPREKRILIASTREVSLAKLAETFGITLHTLKGYNKELVDRLGAESRQAIIDHLLHIEPDPNKTTETLFTAL